MIRNINSKLFYFLLFTIFLSLISLLNSISTDQSLVPTVLNLFVSISIATISILIREIYIQIFKKVDLIYHILILSMFLNILVINTVISGYNIVIVGSVLLIWSLYFYEKRKIVPFVLLLAVSLIGIGNPIIWGVGISLYLFMRSDFKASILVLIVTGIMTLLSSIYSISPLHGLQYLELGRTNQEIFTNLLNNPLTPIEILTRENFVSYYLKTLMQFPLLIVNPISWLLVLPNFAERFLSINQIAWTDLTYFGFILSPLAIYLSVLALAKIKMNLRLPKLYNAIALTVLLPAMIIGILQVGLAPNSRLRALIINEKIELISDSRK